MASIINTKISDVKIIIPKVFEDTRGYFFESWNNNLKTDLNMTTDWVQDNESKSVFGVVRGLHFQKPPYTQAKLVRVINGSVIDIAVDIRKDSPTFKQYVAVELSGENKKQLYIPRGFAHGFVVTSQNATFAYKCDNIYAPEYDAGINFFDPEIGLLNDPNIFEIPFGFKVDKTGLFNTDDLELKLTFSKKDKIQPFLKDIELPEF